MTAGTEVTDLLRTLAPQVVTTLVRRFGGFDSCEDAVQEALLAAAQQWPVEGLPDNPKGWLVTVAARRRTEVWRSDVARQRREEAVGTARVAPPVSDVDDTLKLLLLCCHPSLTPSSQIALTLRAVGGLTTAEIARAFLVPEKTIGQRISRAKQRIRGTEFGEPQLSQVGAVLQVLYLIFNEGYTATSGADLARVDLTAEAIRLARQLRSLLPDDGEVAGLLALMLLTDARRPARTGPGGALIPLADQDRSLWNASLIAEGVALVTSSLATAPIGPYQLQAAIAAVHAEAAHAENTDWRQIVGLYSMLHAIAPGPMVTLNRIVAVAMVEGPGPALALLDNAATDPALADHYRVSAVRAHLLELAGDPSAAREHYRRAARGTLSVPERRYLEGRASDTIVMESE